MASANSQRLILAAIALGPLLLVTACGGASLRPVTGENIDLSRTPQVDAEVAAAVDPHKPQVLLAGSIGDDGFRMRLYTSTTGGARWESGSIATGGVFGRCFSDPSVGIAADGRQYYGYMQVNCGRDPQVGEIVVRTRSGPTGAWSPPQRVAPATGVLEDRPVLAVDTSMSSLHRGRIWIAWTTYTTETGRGNALLAYSNDHGVHWSKPQPPGPGGYEPSLGVAADGSLLEASADPGLDAIIVSSPGRRGFWTRFHAAASAKRWCSLGRKGYLPNGMPNRSICTAPSVAIDQGNGLVYVAWSGWSADGRRHIYVRRFSLASLRRRQASVALPTPLEHGASEQADQFLATAAVDQQTGALWVCYYDTQGDPQRRHARFVCQLSTDHAHSWRQIAAADKPSDEATTFASQFGYGDYESVVAADGQAHPVWTDGRSRSLQEEIFTTTLRERR